MKEQLEEFILNAIGGKWPNDPCLDTQKVCDIRVINSDAFDKEFQFIDDYDSSSLQLGVFYSDHDQQVTFCIRGIVSSRGEYFNLRNIRLADMLESLAKLLKDNVIELVGFSATETPKFSDEDKVDHQTVALLATHEKKWLLSINLKHHMLTLPIGKVHKGEFLFNALCREMWEELGVKLQDTMINEAHVNLRTQFKKTYDFDGTLVNVETFVFHVDSQECYPDNIWHQARNEEPEKCGGLMWVNRDGIRRIAESTGLMLADCVDAALNADMVRVEHVVQ